jgi:hypothetical protein
VAGVFMVIMGLNMLNLFPWLRRFNLRMPKGWGQKVYKNDGRYGPFYIGLLNGLMPCGPLQAMQIYALGTGSFAAGAFSMFMFSLGTVPLMFGLGALSSVLTGKFTHKMVRVSAVLVIGLGIVMVSRGLSLSGVAYASPSSTSTAGIAKVGANTQVVTSQLDSGRYPAIVVQKGIPVRWIIEADPSDINGCNETLVIPKLNLEKKLVAGKNIIEFTPTEEGNINYTCWMGMIGSNIKVVPDINNVSSQDVKVPGSAVSRSGGCCATESGF